MIAPRVRPRAGHAARRASPRAGSATGIMAAVDPDVAAACLAPRSRRRRARSVLTAIAVILGLMVAGAPGASAHALLENSTPAAGSVLQQAPAAVTLSFSESVATTPGWIRIYGSDGSRADTGSPRHAGDRPDTLATSVRPRLPAGSYAVLWRVVSGDGHAVSGRFSFAVQTPSRLPPPESLDAGGDRLTAVMAVLARVAMLAGLSVLLGTLWFAMTVSPRGVWLPAHLTRIALAAAGAGLAGSALLIPARWAEWAQVPLWQALGPGTLSAAVSSRSSLWAMVCVVSFAAALALLARPSAARLGTGAIPVLVPVEAAMFSEVLSGHAATSPQPGLSIPLAVLHLVAVAAWVGALPALLVEVRRALHRPDAPLSPAAARRAEQQAAAAEVLLRGTLRRFMLMSAAVLVVIVITGVGQALLHGVVLSPWMRTQYEVDLGRKLVAVGLVAVLGVTGFVVGRSRLRTWLTAIMAVELAAALAVLTLTALLVRTAPASTALYEPQERTLSAGPVTFSLQWRSLGRAAAAIQLETIARGGDPVGLSALTLEASAVEGSPLQVPVPLQEVATGQWIAPRVALPRSGTWALEISFDRVGGQRRTVTAQVRII
jgi:copper transport protein